MAGLVVAMLGVDGIVTLPNWISETGVVDVALTRELTGVGRDWDSLFRPSLLYFLSSTTSIQIYLAVMVVAAILMSSGIGARWMATTVYLLFLGLCHRIPFLMGPAEYLLCAVLLYLIVDPGKTSRQLRIGFSDSANRFTAHLASRLVRVHLWMWMLFAMLSQLAAVIWWEGEAVWFLSASHRSFLPTRLLASNGILVNVITHGLILSQVTALTCLTKELTRPIGFVAAVIAWIGIGVVSGDVYYAMVGLVASMSFLGPRLEK